MNKLIRFVGNLLFMTTIIILLYAYAMFQGGFVSWFLFFSFLPIFLYYLGLLFYPLQKWKITRRLSHNAIHAGDTVTVTIKIKRKFPLPLYYCIFEEIVPQTLKKIDNRSDKYHYLNDPNKLAHHRQIKKIAFPWFRREIEVQYELDQIPRGEHLLNAIRMMTGDVFGFIKKECVYQIKDELIVYPNQRQMRINGKMMHLNQGESSVQLLLQNNSNVVSGVREYVPGDKFSWIDWKQTARNHVMMTKEFEQEKSTEVLLVLNSCHNVNFNPIAFEAAIEITLSLIIDLQKRESKVDLLSIGDDTVHFQAQGAMQKKVIHHYLTRIQPSHHQSFSKQLLKELANIGRHSFMMIMTTHIDTAFYEAVQKVGKKTDRLIVLFIESEKRILQAELEMIQQLKLEGIITVPLTEKELVASPIEVKI